MFWVKEAALSGTGRDWRCALVVRSKLTVEGSHVRMCACPAVSPGPKLCLLSELSSATTSVARRHRLSNNSTLLRQHVITAIGILCDDKKVTV